MVGREVSLRASAVALGATNVLAVTSGLGADGDQVAASAVRDDRAVMLSINSARVVRLGVPVLDGLSLSVRAGEIVGVAGVEGNGQADLGDVLSSLTSLHSGTVTVDGKEVTSGRAGAMGRAGVAVIPEDRHDSGCVLGMSVADNLLIDRMGSVARFGVISRSARRRAAVKLMREFDIVGAGPDAPFSSLSGGNQQRVVLARELSQQPKVLVAAQPTRGLDVGAIEYMAARLRAAAASGIAVVLISTEMEEILDLADRIVVIARGRVVGELARHEATSERLGLLLGGVESMDVTGAAMTGAVSA
jgi:general nucleoside transport system ATP-binding protein